MKKLIWIVAAVIILVAIYIVYNAVTTELCCSNAPATTQNNAASSFKAISSSDECATLGTEYQRDTCYSRFWKCENIKNEDILQECQQKIADYMRTKKRN